MIYCQHLVITVVVIRYEAPQYHEVLVLSKSKSIAVPKHGTVDEVLSKRQNVRLFNNTKKTALINHVLNTGNIRSACAIVGIDHAWFEKHLSRDLLLKKRVLEAEAKFMAELEKEAFRRGVIGVDRVVYYKGENIGVEKVYSDKLLSDMMIANDPERYGKKSKVDTTTTVNLNVGESQNKLASLLGIKLDEPKPKDQDAIDAEFVEIP